MHSMASNPDERARCTAVENNTASETDTCMGMAYLLCSRSEGARLPRPCQLVASPPRLRIHLDIRMS